MTTTESDPAGVVKDLHLRLPNAHVQITGDLPAEVSDGLHDLADRRLHVDWYAPLYIIEISTCAGGWLVSRGLSGGDASTGGLTIAPLVAGEAPIDLLDMLVGQLNRLSFGSDPSRLHLHGAAVELDGTGILLGGASGSGKSTVTLELLRKGAEYLTDETLSLAPGSRTVFAYPKPITLKAASIDYLTGEREDGRARYAALPTARNGRAHVKASSFSEINPFTQIGIVVLVRYSASERPSLRQMSAAEACVRLVGDSMDAVRLGPGALEAVASIVSGATAWELVYGEAAEAADLVSEIRPPLRRGFTVFHDSSVLEVDRDLPDPGAKAQSRQGECAARSTDKVRVVRFDGSAVLHSGTTGTLMVLEETEIDAIESLGRSSSFRGTDSRQDANSVLARVQAEVGGKVLRRPIPNEDEVLGFGLANRPLAVTEGAHSVTSVVTREAKAAQCTGAVVEQLLRGRSAADDVVSALAMRNHVAGQSESLLVERELSQVVGVLEAARTEPVLLNGPVVSHDGVLPPHMNDLTNLDLLVPPDRMRSAVEALLDAGYGRKSSGSRLRPAKRIRGSAVFCRDWDQDASASVRIELHKALRAGAIGARIPASEVHGRTVPVRVHGTWYRALHPDHRFLHACIQALHGGNVPRVYSVRNLVLSAPRTAFGVDAVVATAVRWRMATVLRQGIEVAEATFPGAMVQDLAHAAQSVRVGRFASVVGSKYLPLG